MYKHILIATDGSELAGTGVDTGLALAKALQAPVTLVTASEPWTELYHGDPALIASSGELHEQQRQAAREGADTLLAGAQARAAAQGIEIATVYVPEREPAEAILETAEECGADLIVMASHGRRGLARLLLGSQTQAVLNRSTLPVLVVR